MGDLSSPAACGSKYITGKNNGVETAESVQKALDAVSNPRKRGGAAYPKRSGMSRRKLRAKQLAPPITQERTNALLNAALKVWSLKHGFND